MLFRAVLTVATFVAAVVAQSTIAFTSWPSTVQVGQSYTITWSGGDSTQPVTIILRAGNPGALATVATITTSATGGSYTWTPSTSIPDGSDYALEISQGTDINYTGEFTVTGSTAMSASSAASSALSSALSVQSSLASVASSGLSTSGSATTTASSSSKSASSTSSGSTSASSTSSGSSSASHAASTGAAAGFSANQAALALGAVAAVLL